MLRRLRPALCLALAGVFLMALAAPAVAAPTAAAPGGGPLSAANLGPDYEPLPTATPLARCAALAKTARGSTCSEGLWRLKAAFVPSQFKDQALVVYELVVHTPSPNDAQGLENSIGRSPWRQAPYRPVYQVTWRTSFQVAARAHGEHYTDWWWFSRGSDFVLLVFVVVPSPVTMAYDQALRDQAAVAVDLSAYGEDLTPASVVRPKGAVMLGVGDLGSVYQSVADNPPMADCATVTGAASGDTCREGVWKMNGADVAADATRMPLAVYELVVRAPNAAGAQTMVTTIAQAGNTPWTMPQYRSVGDDMWQIASQVQPGISALKSATGDWWQGVRGDDFVMLDFVIDVTPATQAYDQTMRDQALAILSEQALFALKAAASAKA